MDINFDSDCGGYVDSRTPDSNSIACCELTLDLNQTGTNFSFQGTPQSIYGFILLDQDNVAFDTTDLAAGPTPLQLPPTIHRHIYWHAGCIYHKKAKAIPVARSGYS